VRFITAIKCGSLVLRPELHARNSPPEPDSTFLAYGGASITTSTLYDGNSRVRQLVDDNGNITTWTYDSLNRETVMTFHDGSTRTNVYNEASNVIEYTDENGSVFTNTFDAAGRKTAVSISLASGVVGTTAQSFQYDGASRMTFARDSVGAAHADVTLVYYSLSRVVEDSQTFDGNTRSVTSEAFTSYPVTQFAFPNGRQITNTFDALYRRTLVEETSGGADIAAWEFFGPGRVAECTLGNGLIQTFMNNARTRSARQENLASPTWGDQPTDRLGYDGAGRMITKRFLAGGINGTTGAYNNTSSLVGQTTVFDKGSNKLYERELHAESRSHLYEPFDDQVPLGGYDSLDRLRKYQRGVLSSTGGQGNAGGGSIVTPISLPNTDEKRNLRPGWPRQLAPHRVHARRRQRSRRTSPAQRPQPDHDRE
jgi:YD repeat-containing protein